MSNLIWRGIPGFPAYIINQYGEVRYEEDNMPVQYEISFGEKFYKLLTPERVVLQRSQISLLVEVFPSE